MNYKMTASLTPLFSMLSFLELKRFEYQACFENSDKSTLVSGVHFEPAMSPGFGWLFVREPI